MSDYHKRIVNRKEKLVFQTIVGFFVTAFFLWLGLVPLLVFYQPGSENILWQRGNELSLIFLGMAPVYVVLGLVIPWLTYRKVLKKLAKIDIESFRLVTKAANNEKQYNITWYSVHKRKDKLEGEIDFAEARRILHRYMDKSSFQKSKSDKVTFCFKSGDKLRLDVWVFPRRKYPVMFVLLSSLGPHDTIHSCIAPNQVTAEYIIKAFFHNNPEVFNKFFCGFSLEDASLLYLENMYPSR